MREIGGRCLSRATQENVNLIWGDIPEWAYVSVASLLGCLRKVDEVTFHHCIRVGEYSRLLARDAGLNEFQQKVAEFSGILHDIGKSGIQSSVIHKPGKLTDLEYEHMKQHSLFSEQIIEPLAVHDFFRQVLPAVRGHHERLDGRGYPDQLHGEKIPLISRVILIVDTLDAMSENRAYRQGLPIDRIYAEIKKYSGTQFDAGLAQIFLEGHKHWHLEKSEAETLEKISKKVA